MVVGGALALLGLFVGLGVTHDGGRQFATAWLLAYMFCLSICLGALFLVIVHHLFDAGWSVSIRRFCEHIASLFESFRIEVHRLPDHGGAPHEITVTEKPPKLKRRRKATAREERETRPAQVAVVAERARPVPEPVPP